MAGTVGSLGHILRKTFSELYEENQTVEETLKIDNQQIETGNEPILDEKHPTNDEEQSIDDDYQQIDNENQQIENENQPIDNENQPIDNEKQPIDNERQSPEEEKVVVEKQRLDEIQPETSMDIECMDKIVKEELDKIEIDLANRHRNAESLEKYLNEQRSKASHADEREEELMYKKGLILGAEIPVERSHFELLLSDLERFPEYSASLILPKQILKENEDTEMYKRGQVKSEQRGSIGLRPSTPNYQKNKKLPRQKSSTAKKKPLKLEDELLKSELADQETIHRPVRMGNDEKEANMKVIKKMENQISFLKNPRFLDVKNRDYKASLLNRDASDPFYYGAKEISKQEALLMETDGKSICFGEKYTLRVSEASKTSFKVEPAYARFAAYQVGKKYHQVISFSNTGTISKSIKFLPPTSKYFALSNISHPSEAGMIAPGMSCQVTVTFCADSLGDYDDFMTVITETERFRVALVSKRPPPQVTLPGNLNTGNCFVGDSTFSDFSCTNLGGPGKFQLLSDEDWTSMNPSQEYHKRPHLSVGPFQISPVNFTMENGDVMKLGVTYTPQACGIDEYSFLIVCDNCQVRSFTLTGTSCQVKIRASSIDNLPLDDSNLLLRQPTAMIFPDTTVGSLCDRVLTYRNCSPIDLKFHWNLFSKQISKKKKNKFTPGCNSFEIFPLNGVLPAFQELEFSVKFVPLEIKESFGVAELIIEDVPPSAVSRESDITISKEEQLSLNSLVANVSYCCLFFQGSGSEPKVEVVPVCRFDSTLIGQERIVSLMLKNRSSTITMFKLRQAGNEPFCAIPCQYFGALRPFEELPISFKISSVQSGIFSMDLIWDLYIKEDIPCAITCCTISGHFKGPSVRILNRELDFGLLGVSDAGMQYLTLKNHSDVPAEVTLEAIETTYIERLSQQENDFAQLSMEFTEIILAPQEERQIPITCQAGISPQRLRKVLKVSTMNSAMHVVKIRGEIQAPKVFLEISDEGSLSIDLGITYTTVPVLKQMKLINLSNLPATFKWSEVGGINGGGYTGTFNQMFGTLAPKEIRSIYFTYIASKPGKVDTMFACDVDGIPIPLGFNLKTVSKGLVVGYSIVQDKKKGVEKSDEPSSKIPSIDFGDELELCKRKTICLAITNYSAIPAGYAVTIKSFQAKSRPRSFEHTSMVNKEKIQLGDNHEGFNMFSSEAGQSHVRAKLAREEDQQVLTSGDGVAFLATPPTGVLDPWKTIYVDIVCFNNMPGRYRSEIACDVGSLPPVNIPIRVGISGSPLTLSKNTAGLVITETGSHLRFGQSLVGTSVVHKTIKVVNDGPIASKLSWRVTSNRDPTAGLIQASIEFDEEGMKANKDIRVRVRVEPHSELSTLPPFYVSPSEQIVKAYSTATFQVSYVPDSECVAQSVACMLADSEWVTAIDGSLAEESKSIVESMGSFSHQLSSNATKSISSTGTVNRDVMQDVLRVELEGKSTKPSLKLDRTLRGVIEHQYLGFVVWSTSDQNDSSFFKTITLSNSSPIFLGCAVQLDPPFYLAECSLLSPTVASLSKEFEAVLDSKPHIQKLSIPSGAVLVLTIQYRPKENVYLNNQDVNEHLRTTEKGLLVLHFHNNDTQSVVLEGTIVEPIITVAPCSYDFGFTNTECSKQSTLRLSNPSVVPCVWKIQHIPSSEDNIVDDPSRWSFDVESGTLNGPTLPLTSSHAFMPQGLDSNRLRAPGIVNVCFSPCVQEQYQSTFRFHVSSGVSFDVVVRGHGSFYEEHDSSLCDLPNATSYS